MDFLSKAECIRHLVIHYRLLSMQLGALSDDRRSLLCSCVLETLGQHVPNYKHAQSCNMRLTWWSYSMIEATNRENQTRQSNNYIIQYRLSPKHGWEKAAARFHPFCCSPSIAACELNNEKQQTPFVWLNFRPQQPQRSDKTRLTMHEYM